MCVLAPVPGDRVRLVWRAQIVWHVPAGGIHLSDAANPAADRLASHLGMLGGRHRSLPAGAAAGSAGVVLAPAAFAGHDAAFAGAARRLFYPVPMGTDAGRPIYREKLD